MRVTRRRAFAATVTLGACLFVSVASHSAARWPPVAEPPTRGVEGKPAELLSGDIETRLAAAQEMRKHRRAAVGELISILTDDSADRSYHGPVHLAAVMLGALRAEEAVDPLSARLSYLPPSTMIISQEDLPIEAYYPCARALADIGQSAIPAMVRVVWEPPDELSTRLALWVIMEVEGRDQAAHRFETLAEKTSDPRYRDRCEAARKYIESYQPDRSSPYRPPKPAAPPASTDSPAAGE